MRILLLGEYSNLHNTLAEGLRALGHEVTVASNGDFWKNYPRDIDLERKAGPLGGIKLLGKVVANLHHFSGFDIVQLINPLFIELKAERLFPIYRYLRKNNKKIVLGGFGMDYYWVKTCVEDKLLRYSDFNIGSSLRNNKEALEERKDWIGTAKERLNRLIAEDCDAIVTCLYEYWACYQHCFPKKTRFIPLPIKMPKSIETTRSNDKIKLFIGVNKSRSAYKGTDIMLKAAKEITNKHKDKVELTVAESVPFNEYQRMMDGSDAILDQLYSYTPSMNSLLAMSKGIIDIGGGEPENYHIIGEKELRPIVNVTPSYENVYETLEHFVSLKPEEIEEKKKQSHLYVLRHHEYIEVAKKYEALYHELLR